MQASVGKLWPGCTYSVLETTHATRAFCSTLDPWPRSTRPILTGFAKPDGHGGMASWWRLTQRVCVCVSYKILASTRQECHVQGLSKVNKSRLPADHQRNPTCCCCYLEKKVTTATKKSVLGLLRIAAEAIAFLPLSKSTNHSSGPLRRSVLS